MSQYNHTEKFSYQKINDFFVEEIPHLQTPIINNRPNCVTVGPYRVITNAKVYEIWRSRRHLCDFARRSWAVGYALCLYQNKSTIAQQLLNANKQYTKLIEEQYIYNHHMSIAQKRNDVSKQDIFWCRLSRTENEMFSLESTTNTVLKSIQLG